MFVDFCIQIEKLSLNFKEAVYYVSQIIGLKILTKHSRLLNIHPHCICTENNTSVVLSTL